MSKGGGRAFRESLSKTEPFFSEPLELTLETAPTNNSCKELQNLNAFFAIIMGLSNMAVARLTQTWERLPSKLKRTFSQFESQIDPSRNHRRYRIFISKLEPPLIPFMPLFLKDMTFAHEGNKTLLENGLINFEKMVSHARQPAPARSRTIGFGTCQPPQSSLFE